MRSFRGFMPLLGILAVAACDDPITAPVERAELAVMADAPTQTIYLGSIGGSYSHATDINDNNVVVGYAENGSGYPHAFRWTKTGGMKDLGSLGGPESFSMAAGINEHGVIAGLSTDDEFQAHVVLWTPQGQIRDLGKLPTDFGFLDAGSVVGINNLNEIIGNYYEAELYGWGLDVPFHWTQATGRVDYPWGIPTDPEGENPRSWVVDAINDRGDVVGTVHGTIFFSERGIGYQELGSFGGAFPNSISDLGTIVGKAGGSPFRWTRATGFQDLGSLGGGEGEAYDVNDLGEIVGFSRSITGELRAFYWTQARGMVDLGPGFAEAINEKSVIAGHVNSQAVIFVGTGGVAP